MAGIQWLSWGVHAFRKAKREQKPVLVDIFGIWCHWCHMMDEQYQDARVIERVNAHFVPVKVDTDRMPDVNLRYNQGGWPSIVFLDGDGTLMAGTTFLKADDLVRALDAALQLFRRKAAEQSAAPSPNRLSLEVLEHVVTSLITAYDPMFGGFGAQAKFPDADALALLLRAWRLRGNISYFTIVEKSLSGILDGLYDAHEGGFFRYSASRDWKTPHYEKTLETNADMIWLLAQFLEITFFVPAEENSRFRSNVCELPSDAMPEGVKRDRFSSALDQSVAYVLNVLASPRGGFYGSQDADGEEAYYGKSFVERKKLERPRVDRTIFCDLNGMMMSALISYVRLVARRDGEQAAFTHADAAIKVLERTATFLLTTCWSPSRGMAHYREGRRSVWRGLLKDNVRIAHALLELSDVSGKRSYRQRALTITRFIERNFFHPSGVLYDRMPDRNDVGRLKIRYQLVADNAEVAQLFLDAGTYTRDNHWGTAAKRALEPFLGVYAQDPKSAAGYALAVARLLNPTP